MKATEISINVSFSFISISSSFKLATYCFGFGVSSVSQKGFDKVEIGKGESIFLLLMKAPLGTKKLSCNYDLLEISILVYIPCPLFY